MATAQEALPGPAFSNANEGFGGANRREAYPADNANYPLSQSQQLGNQVGPLLQRSLPGIIMVVTLFALVLLYNWINTGDYRPLFPNMPESEKSEAFDLLSGSAFPARLDSRTGDILVPADRYYEARMMLASSGFADPSSAQSMNMLDDQSSLTSSQFMEEARYRAATENELAKSIVQISSIKTARVHLAAPRQSSYVRNRVPAKASVVVVGHPGRIVTQAHVQSITSLVSSSVPYLAVEDVSVVDQQGNLLTMSMSPGLKMADMQSTYKRSIESDYKARIEQLLAPIVGIENVNSDVDASIDFSEFETTSEVFDEAGRGPISRSEVLSVDRSRGGSNVGGIPGAQSNIAPNDTAINNTNDEAIDPIEQPSLQTSEPTSTRTTRNYELDRSIKYSKDAVGNITRLSIAVVINQKVLDGVAGEDVDGEETPRIGALNVEQLTELVKSSVGFDEARGDQVLVIGSPFMEATVIEEITTPWFENSSIQFIAQMIGIVIAFALTLLFVVRPVLANMLKKNDGPSSRNAGGGNYQQAFASYEHQVAHVQQMAGHDAAKVASNIKDMIRK